MNLWFKILLINILPLFISCATLTEQIAGRNEVKALPEIQNSSCKLAAQKVNDDKNSGGLSREEISSVVESNTKNIKSCYNTSSRGWEGKLKTDFWIGPTGCVATVKVDNSSDFPDANVTKCVMKEITSWKFPKPRNNTNVEIKYPFEFSRALKTSP